MRRSPGRSSVEDLQRASTRMAALIIDGVALRDRAAGPRRHRLRRHRRPRASRPHPRAPRRPITAARSRSASATSSRLPRQSSAGASPMRASSRSCFRARIRDNLVYGLRHRPARTTPRRTSARRRAGSPRRSAPATRSRASTRPLDRLRRSSAPRDEDELDRILIDLLRPGRPARTTSTASACPAWSTPSATRSSPSGSSRRARACARPSTPTAWPISSSPSIPSATTTRRRSPRTSCSACRPRAALIGPRARRACRLPRRPRARGLTDDLVAMGAADRRDDDARSSAACRPGHPLFEQFSFIGADELAEFEAHPAPRRDARRGRRTATSSTRLLSLPLAYIEPRHRLGLLDDASRSASSRRAAPCARCSSATAIPASSSTTPRRSAPAAPLQDNLLFGRVNYSVANAQARVTEAIAGGDRRARPARGRRARRPRPSGRPGRAAAHRAAAGEHQSRALPREAAGPPRRRRRARALRRDAARQAMLQAACSRPSRGAQLVHRAAERPRRRGLRRGDPVRGRARRASSEGASASRSAKADAGPRQPTAVETNGSGLQEAWHDARDRSSIPAAGADVPRHRSGAAEAPRLHERARAVRRRPALLLAGRRRRRRLRHPRRARPTCCSNTPGGEIKVAELGRNALVGEMGILSDNPRSATIVAAAADDGAADRQARLPGAADAVPADVDRGDARAREPPRAHQRAARARSRTAEPAGEPREHRAARLARRLRGPRLARTRSPGASAPGLVLFAFALTHFLNHALGHRLRRAMEAVQAVRRGVWRSWPGTVAALRRARGPCRPRPLEADPPPHLAHGALGGGADRARPAHPVARRRACRGDARPRTASTASTTPTAASCACSGRMLAFSQSLLLVVVWLHAIIGLHFWLRTEAPGTRAGARCSSSSPCSCRRSRSTGWIEARAPASPLDPVRTRRSRRTAWRAAAACSSPGARRASGACSPAPPPWRSSRCGCPTGSRAGRRSPIRRPHRARAAPGATLLEISRAAGVPHAAVCGGRGRCTTCRVLVLEGARQAAAAEPDRSGGAGAHRTRRRACGSPARSGRTHALTVRPLDPAAARPSRPPAATRYRWGVERRITVMFADLRGFTTLAERLYPYDSVFLLNRYFEVMTRGDRAQRRRGRQVSRRRHHGAVRRRRPARGAGSRDALRAARDMLAALDGLNEEFEATLAERLRMGIGLHIGPAVLGRVGGGRIGRPHGARRHRQHRQPPRGAEQGFRLRDRASPKPC